MIKLIIFDFDGTLADTKKLILDTIVNTLGKFNYKLEKKFVNILGDNPLERFLEDIGVEGSLIGKISSIAGKGYSKEYQKIKFCRGIKKLSSIKAKKVIISNNLTRFIVKSLKFAGIDYFDEVYGSDKFKNKVNIMLKIIKKHKLKASEVVYVGDKPRDVEVAREAGCFSVILSNRFSWGKRAEVLKEKPDFVISNLGKLNKTLKKIDSL